jgi:perosamine synthetase
MIVTDNEEWARQAKHLTTQAKDDPIEYTHSQIGYNYRLTNVQAAIGLAQIERLSAYVEAKRRIASIYREGLRDAPMFEPMPEAKWARSVFWMYTVLVDAERASCERSRLMSELASRGIQTRPLWQPLHRSKAHEGSFATDCSIAERLNSVALSLPCSVGLEPRMQHRVIENLKAISRTA